MKNKAPYQRIVFDNGLVVLLYPLISLQSVYTVLYTRSGTFYETKESNGLSHFTEHMIYEGTKSYPSPSSLSKAYEVEGILHGASTSNLDTVFWFKSSSEKANKAFKLFSELILSPLLPASRMENVRKVILNEYADKWRYPESQFSQRLMDSRFVLKDHPYTYDALGSQENIKKFSYSDVLLWKNRFYQPGNMVISIAGNFEEKTVSAFLKETFGKLSKEEQSHLPELKEDRYSDFHLYHKFIERDQVLFTLTFPCFGFKEVPREKRLTLTLLEVMIGRGQASRFYKALREKKSLVYDVGIGHSYFPWKGFLSIEGSTGKDNLLEVLTIIRREIAKVLNSGFTDKEISRSKNIISSSTSFYFESPQGIADSLATQEIDGEKIWLPDDYSASAKKINKGKVEELAREIFNFEKINVGLFGNFNETQTEKIKKILCSC